MSISQTTINTSLEQVICDLEPAAKIPALKAIANSMTARTIGTIKRNIEANKRKSRDETDDRPSLDVRNEMDENNRAADDIRGALGFNAQIDYELLASVYHGCFDWARAELATISNGSKYDAPMDVGIMLDYMIDNSQSAPEEFLQAFAKAAKIPVDALRKMESLQHTQERALLIAMRPEIIRTFNSYGANGYNHILCELIPTTEYQLGVKIVASLRKAQDTLLGRILKSRKFTELASITFIEDGITKVSAWVKRAETRYSDLIQDAINNGASMPSLEDNI